MSAHSGSDASRIAIVTPTYLPDLARCELLVESLQQCSPGLRHILVVDRCDLAHFRHLGDRATILQSEALLPRWVKRIPGRRSIWLSPWARPTRGWIVQQILKIAAAATLEHEISVFCDSDVAFIRPFSINEIVGRGPVGLLDVDYVTPQVEDWTAVAARLLGVEPSETPARGHVGNMITWRRENVRSMIERISEVSGTGWQRAILRLPTFSEYILYGVYCRAVLGYQRSGHVPSTTPLIKGSWGLDLTREDALQRFFSDFDTDTVGVMIHSRDGLDAAQYRRYLEGLWEQRT